MPPMKATGMNTAIRDSVVASTAKPISLVARTAAGNGFLDEADDVLEHDDGVVDHDADREGEREQRDVVQRVALEPHQAEGADDRDRDRERRDQRAPHVAEEEQHDRGRQQGADDQVLDHRAYARADGLRVVADDRQLHPRRHGLAQELDALSNIVDDLDGVRAGLLDDRQEDDLFTVVASHALDRLLIVDHTSHVGEAQDAAVLRPHHEPAHGLDRGHAAVDAQGDALGPRLEVAARRHQVLLLERGHHVDRREARRAQGERVHPHVDLTLTPADDRDLADAEDGLELARDLLVGDLGQIAQALPFTAHAEVEHRRGARLDLADDRLLDAARQLAQDRVHLVAHLLRRDVGVLVELEHDDDLGDALARHGVQVVDARDLVDGALDLVGDVGLDLLGRGARQLSRDHDHRYVDVRKLIDTEAAVADRAEHQDHEHQDRCEHRPLHADSR
jgi:hypothetical protein